MNPKLLEKFSIYGPDLAIAGIAIVLALFVALATEAIQWWQSTIGLAAVFGTRAAGLFYDTLRKKLYRQLAAAAGRALRVALGFRAVRSVLPLLAFLALSAASVWLFWRTADLLSQTEYAPFRTALAWSAFASAVAIIAIGIAGQYLWFRWRRTAWGRLNT